MERQFETPQLIALTAGEVHGLRVAPPGRLRILDGRVWVTEEHLLDDVFATRGDEIALTHRGTTVIEGLTDARVAVVVAAAPWPRRVLRALRWLVVWARSATRPEGNRVAPCS
jgi:hypothetical protein